MGKGRGFRLNGENHPLAARLTSDPESYRLLFIPYLFAASIEQLPIRTVRRDERTVSVRPDLCALQLPIALEGDDDESTRTTRARGPGDPCVTRTVSRQDCAYRVYPSAQRRCESVP